MKGTDKVAAYGIAGLIAGAVATKAGLFKVILAGMLAAKKFVLIGLAALGAWGRKLWARWKGAPAAPPAA